MLAIETMITGRMQPSLHLHRSHFLEYVDLSNECGLEIGAFDLPLVEPSEDDAILPIGTRRNI